MDSKIFSEKVNHDEKVTLPKRIKHENAKLSLKMILDH